MDKREKGAQAEQSGCTGPGEGGRRKKKWIADADWALPAAGSSLGRIVFGCLGV